MNCQKKQVARDDSEIENRVSRGLKFGQFINSLFLLRNKYKWLKRRWISFCKYGQIFFYRIALCLRILWRQQNCSFTLCITCHGSRLKDNVETKKATSLRYVASQSMVLTCNVFTVMTEQLCCMVDDPKKQLKKRMDANQKWILIHFCEPVLIRSREGSIPRICMSIVTDLVLKAEPHIWDIAGYVAWKNMNIIMHPRHLFIHIAIDSLFWAFDLILKNVIF